MSWNPDTIAMPGFQTLEVTIKSCWLYSRILFGLYIVFELCAWHSILTIHEDLNMLPCPVVDVKSETQLFNASKVFNDMLRLGVRKFKRERTYAGLCLCSRPFEFRPCEEYDWRPWSSSTWATKWKCVHPSCKLVEHWSSCDSLLVCCACRRPMHLRTSCRRFICVTDRPGSPSSDRMDLSRIDSFLDIALQS